MVKNIFFVAALLSTPAFLFAQASPTGIRRASLQVGAGFSNANTDYVPNRVNGTTIYADYDFFHHLGLEGEFRYLKDGRSNIYEKTYGVGPRYSRTYGRFSPYVKGLYGRGVFNFTYRGERTANLAYNLVAFGGGVDYRLLRHVNVRGEYEYQRWFGFPLHGLTPSAVTIGAAYRF
ncbi:porin family protein [Edaphobacter sp. 12200R-103]|uniref:porin family protein n=1 Tax=Edaphobacter sp. 12200R-103 TaxID=2703788 RepID=UPI00138C95EC|nr:porin family protein [Edaphobacter sp. 12200R-103]QHS51841.1 porin family protein [Edaphobacter sp. 12200R-103]